MNILFPRCFRESDFEKRNKLIRWEFSITNPDHVARCPQLDLIPRDTLNILWVFSHKPLQVLRGLTVERGCMLLTSLTNTENRARICSVSLHRRCANKGRNISSDQHFSRLLHVL